MEGVICVKARALGEPLGLFSSAQNGKATWPAVEILVSNCHSVQITDERRKGLSYARLMFMTRAKAFDKQYN